MVMRKKILERIKMTDEKIDIKTKEDEEKEKEKVKDQETEPEKKLKVKDYSSLLPTPEEFHSTETKQEEDAIAQKESVSDSQEMKLIEEIAAAQGWSPKDEFESNPENEGKKWKPAVDYLKGAPLVERIKAQGRDLQELKGVNEAVLKMLQNQTERAVQERATKILEEKRMAIEEGNVDKTEELEKQYNDVLKEMPAKSQQQQQQEQIPTELPPEYKSFVELNKAWFNNKTPKNQEMVAFADAYNESLARINGDLTIAERLAKVKKAVMLEFGEQFENPNREKAAIVEKSTPTGENKQEITYHDLPIEAQNVINNLLPKIRLGNKTVSDYRNEYARKLVESGAISLK
jgi:hypothetical protein